MVSGAPCRPGTASNPDGVVTRVRWLRTEYRRRVTVYRETERSGRLDGPGVAEVLALAEVANTADGARPLSEAFELRLRHAEPSSTVQHLTIRAEDTTIVAYAQLNRGEAELFVHPAHRRQGLGGRLATEVLADVGDGSLSVWAHGDHPSASALGLTLGLERYRTLWQMRRPLTTPVTEPTLPAGVRVRPFRPGADDEPWLALNNRAFADHPDQGTWTLDNLAVRKREPWFDPAGFLIAEARRAARWSASTGRRCTTRGPNRSVRCTCWGSGRRRAAPGSAAR